MRIYKAFLFVFFIAVVTPVQSQDFSPEGACQWRAGILGSVAQERDKGVSKATVLRKLYSRIPELRKTEIEYWVGIVYSKDAQRVPPTKIAEMILTVCMNNIQK